MTKWLATEKTRLRREEGEANVKGENEALEEAMRQDIDSVLREADEEAAFVASTGELQNEFRRQAPRIVESAKMGKGTRDGKGRHMTKDEGIAEARSRFIQKAVNIARQEVREKWTAIYDEKAAERRVEREEREENEEEEARVQAIRDAQANEEFAQKMDAARADLRRRMAIPNFERAMAPVTRCEHIEVRFWGHSMGKGLVCKDCGVELTQTYKDDAQTCTVDPDMEEMVQRHRMNPGVFKFRSGLELKQVEEERMRLEKDRWDVNKVESVFYDRAHCQEVTNFYARHRYEIADDVRNLKTTRNALIKGVETDPTLIPILAEIPERSDAEIALMSEGFVGDLQVRIFFPLSLREYSGEYIIGFFVGLGSFVHTHL